MVQEGIKLNPTPVREKNIKIQCALNLGIVFLLHPQRWLYTVLDALSVHILIIGSFFRRANHHIMPDTLKLRIGKRLTFEHRISFSGCAFCECFWNMTGSSHRWPCSFSFSAFCSSVPIRRSTLAFAVKTSCIPCLACWYSA